VGYGHCNQLCRTINGLAVKTSHTWATRWIGGGSWPHLSFRSIARGRCHCRVGWIPFLPSGQTKVIHCPAYRIYQRCADSTNGPTMIEMPRIYIYFFHLYYHSWWSDVWCRQSAMFLTVSAEHNKQFRGIKFLLLFQFCDRTRVYGWNVKHIQNTEAIPNLHRIVSASFRLIVTSTRMSTNRETVPANHRGRWRP